MPVEIEVVVRSTNHGTRSETVFRRRYETGGANPRFDGDVVRRETAALGERIAADIEKLVPDPIRRDD